MPDWKTIKLETPAEGIARIVMNRPEARNAQDLDMTYELHEAYDQVLNDTSVKVVILAGADPHFSAGHDLSRKPEKKLGLEYPRYSSWGGFEEPAAEGRFAREQEIYLESTRRLYKLSKPTIAEVQGRCIAGGLMLAWACDLIIASEDAQFCDPVVAMGICGVEWFVHPQELGTRKAKELLWTGDNWSAAEAYRLGMVNHVVSRSDLSAFTLDLALKIAKKPPFAVSLTKDVVNKAAEFAGQMHAIDYAFGLHHLCHANNVMKFGEIIDPAGFPASMRKKEA